MWRRMGGWGWPVMKHSLGECLNGPRNLTTPIELVVGTVLSSAARHSPTAPRHLNGSQINISSQALSLPEIKMWNIYPGFEVSVDTACQLCFKSCPAERSGVLAMQSAQSVRHELPAWGCRVGLIWRRWNCRGMSWPLYVHCCGVNAWNLTSTSLFSFIELCRVTLSWKQVFADVAMPRGATSDVSRLGPVAALAFPRGAGTSVHVLLFLFCGTL
jgi:hypothetical protein